MSRQKFDGKLVRWYRYSHDGRIKAAGHGIVIKQIDHVYSHQNQDLNTFEILIDGDIEIFTRRDFEIVGQEIKDDESKEK